MLIGLVGLAGSGKSTVASILCNHYSFAEESFASPLKDAAASIFGWDRDVLDGRTEQDRAAREKPDAYWSTRLKRPVSMRSMLRELGTEVFRDKLSLDIWVDSLKFRIKSSGYRNIVVSDVRFPNEIECIVSLGGHIVRVSRNDPLWLSELLSGGNIEDEGRLAGIHRSEYEWVRSKEQIKYTIENSGSLDDLTNDITLMLLRVHMRTFIERCTPIQ